MKEILERIEQLNRETSISLAVYDPAAYKAKMKELQRLNKKLQKMMR